MHKICQTATVLLMLVWICGYNDMNNQIFIACKPWNKSDVLEENFSFIVTLSLLIDMNEVGAIKWLRN